MPVITGYAQIVRFLQWYGTILKKYVILLWIRDYNCHTFKKLSVTGVPGTWETYVNSRSDL